MVSQNTLKQKSSINIVQGIGLLNKWFAGEETPWITSVDSGHMHDCCDYKMS